MASEAVEDKKSKEASVEKIEELKPPEKEEGEVQTKNEEVEHGKSDLSEKELEEEVKGEDELEAVGEEERAAESEGDSDGKGESKGELEEKNVEEGEEKKEESEGEEARELSKEKDTKVKKRGRRKSGEKKMDSPPSLKEPVTPTSDRPTRERKTVERYSVTSTANSGRSSAGKGLSIEKGCGTPLRDIPNVAFKLSKRKADDNLQVLHTILFGKKAKVHNLKRNINQFSGYVWLENEKEKQRLRVKEKLDKCVKEKLVDFCDVLNIQISKAGIKKEELSAKLLEFLESPHATTDVILADKEQKPQKRKRKVTPNKALDSAETTIETSVKKQKSQSGKPTKDVPKLEGDEVDDKVESSDEKSSFHEDDDNDSEQNKESDNKESKLEDEKSPKEMSSPKVASRSTPKEKATSSKKQASAKIVKEATKSKEKPSLSTKRKGNPDKASGLTSKSKASKKQKIEESKPKKEKPRKGHSTKSPAKVAKDQAGKGKSSKKSKAEPSKEEMHAVVVNILKEVDFNTATLSDILRQLGSHFRVDLMHRKAEVKDIITEVISNMSDEDEGDEAEDDDDDDSGKDDDNGDA